jgi:hypothetical protein
VQANAGLAAANIAAAVLTTVLAIGSTIAAWVYRDQVGALQFEHRRTQVAQSGLVSRLEKTQNAERQGRLELGKSLQAEGAALQRTGLSGQRFKSLDRLASSASTRRAAPVCPTCATKPSPPWDSQTCASSGNATSGW